jgi:DNA primase
VQISIEYKLNDSSQWHFVDFSPEEYFDLDPDEEVAWDCVPEYNHAIDYLDVDLDNRLQTIITI